MNERSLLFRGLPFARMATIGDVYIDVFVVLTILHFSSVHRQSSLVRLFGEDASMARSDSLLNAVFRSCSPRC